MGKLGGIAPNAGIGPAIEELRTAFGDRLSTARAVLLQHGKDMTYHDALPPDAVLFAQSSADVQQAVRICAKHCLPIIPFGAGSSLEGHISAPMGGLSIDLTGMNNIIAVNSEDMDITVEPGVTREQIDSHLRDIGLFFPIDPGAQATIGGMAATRASGTNAVRYGTMRDAVLGVEVVLPDGSLVKTGTRARKSSAGYDLTRLFVGSEGTLGIMTSITLRVHGIPEAISAATCSFETLEGAVNATMQTIQLGVPVARIELLDDVQIDAINRYSGLELPLKNTLFLEFHGSNAGVGEQTETVRQIVAENGGDDFKWAVLAEERAKLWKARHNAAWAAKGLRPGMEACISDVCVPISRMAECVLETKQDIVSRNLVAPIVGHVGDGNFHVLFIMDVADSDEVARVEDVNDRMVRRALAMGGTCTGEHGVGIGKKQYLRDEQGSAVDLMRVLKGAIDPKGIMNPGKLFD